MIVVNPSRTLERRTGIELLHLPDGRALIAFDQTRTAAALELLIEDALEDRGLPAADREIFEAIADILKSARRSDRVRSCSAASSCSKPANLSREGHA